MEATYNFQLQNAADSQAELVRSLETELGLLGVVEVQPVTLYHRLLAAEERDDDGGVGREDDEIGVGRFRGR